MDEISDDSLYPPFAGDWRKREEVPGGLDAAKGDLMRICFFDPTDYPQWHLGGFRTGDVQHWVNVEPQGTMS